MIPHFHKHALLKHPLLTGTVFLTGAGVLSRILGFFYRIYLSRTIGAEGLGIYQMVMPVYGICFSLCAGSIQTAISRFTAAEHSRSASILKAGILISSGISLCLALILRVHAGFIAGSILSEPRCAALLPILAPAIPCTALHACICGYFYGRQQVRIPALSQLIEQCIRILTAALIAQICIKRRIPVTMTTAAAALTAGEAGSALFAVISYRILRRRQHHAAECSQPQTDASVSSSARTLMALALPLMANRLVMNILQSLEAILIPGRLEHFGLSAVQSVSLYGVLTGMAMPVILFPSAIINSLAVILLPNVARCQSNADVSGIRNTISLSFQCSLYMGILFLGLFLAFGDSIGTLLYRNMDAGSFITILAWLCPFFYLSTGMGSILNGLGKTTVTFVHNIAALLIRLAFTAFGIPVFGIHACLWGILLSEIVRVLLHYYSLYRLTGFYPDTVELLLKPAVSLLVSLNIGSCIPVRPLCASDPFWLSVLPLLLQAGFVTVLYILFLSLWKRRKPVFS